MKHKRVTNIQQNNTVKLILRQLLLSVNCFVNYTTKLQFFVLHVIFVQLHILSRAISNDKNVKYIFS